MTLGRFSFYMVFLFAVGIATTHSALATYAAMDAAPARSGELRLKQMRTATGTAARCAASETGQLVAFPLKRTDVDARISGVVAAVTVDQTFENCFEDPIEAVYVFPLPDGAAVHAYEIAIGNRTIKGVIREAAEAQRIYEEARRQGQTAGILEQGKENVFQQSIANIAPREAIRVRISYVERINYEDGGYRFVFPMVVGPRFVPEGTADPNAVGGHRAENSRDGGVSVPYAASRTGHEVSVRVHVEAGLPMGDVTSPSHEIDVRRDGASAVDVTLSPRDSIPNKDFTLDFRTASRDNVIAALAHRRDSDGYFLLVVQPKADWPTAEITAREVVVLIDRSGSMSGPPIAQAKAVARGILETLRPTDTFNVIAFASGQTSFQPDPIAATSDNVNDGIRFIDGLVADGGTYMVDGLKQALHRAAGADQIRMVFMLTDGYVGNDNEVVAAVQREDGTNRIFTVGVGSSPNRALLNQLAEVGRGFSSYLRHDEDHAKLVEKLKRRTTSPAIVDGRFDWNGIPVSDLTPRLIPDVFVGQPVVVAGRYSEPQSGVVDFRARVAASDGTLPIQLDLPADSDRREIALLWARQRIHELTLTDPYERSAEVRRQVTDLGLRYSLVTRYTSFVAVDETRVVDANGTARTVEQPAEMPEGVNADAALGRAPSSGGTAASSGYSGSYSGRSGVGAVDPLVVVLGAALVAASTRRRRTKTTR